MAPGSEAIGTTATEARTIGFAALSASAFAVVAVTAVSIRRLVVRNAPSQRIEVDEVIVYRLDVRDEAPAD